MRNLPNLAKRPGPNPMNLGFLGVLKTSYPLKGDLTYSDGTTIPILTSQKKPLRGFSHSSVFSPKSADFGSKKEVMSRLFFWQLKFAY